MSEVDDVVFRSQEVLDRTRAGYGAGTRARKRREREIVTRVGRVLAADAAIIVAAVAIGFIVPLGMFGALAVMALLIAATLFFALLPAGPAPRPERFGQIPLKALPRQTEAWLEQQRPALPAPAVNLIDTIGTRLETLAPQLAALDENTPAAVEVRKLVGEQLPELVKGYQRVPEPLRRTPRNGRTPDEQLVDGLRTIETEIGEMTQQLAQGDLDLLSTRERYLQIRYRDDEGVGK
ncbi:hypothetical protein LZK98_05460 [Sphingomonas cannabina]|uniref:hypothetical protein n=1 Tax=Sphingomonas cannabina TaxID=2899123 RepID=UPI001F17EF0B|nr:hypothetical protein [Sphingomonas cannabina]UIJ46393.1 hypothetical protein LZK98_05460 [Sphingomonas cannabina]